MFDIKIIVDSFFLEWIKHFSHKNLFSYTSLLSVVVLIVSIDTSSDLLKVVVPTVYSAVPAMYMI